MDRQNPSFVEGTEDGGNLQNDLLENQDREEQKDFNKCRSILGDESECINKNEIINETDSVNLVQNESPGQEEEVCQHDSTNYS